jgi:hypothetical protein
VPELELPEPMLPEEEPVEPLAALPLRFDCWSALEPVPALSRLHAAMPNARAAAVNAAVSVFIIAVISCPEGGFGDCIYRRCKAGATSGSANRDFS